MTEIVEWLNTNTGSVSAVSTALSALFAAAAALAAFVSIGRATRRERCNIDVYVNASTAGALGGSEPSVQFTLINLGPAAPLSGSWDFDRRSGDSLPLPLAPGSSKTLAAQNAADCRKWCRVKISWLEPTGRRRRIRFWYRVDGRVDAPDNQRKYVRVERDERASYLNGPTYLRRWPPPLGYVGWRYRKAAERRLWRAQEAARLEALPAPHA